ncbi:MAG: threonine synthase [Betaproteobacteria bacterium]
MKYISTRGVMVGGGRAQSFLDILLGGLAPDGGLAMPASYPQVTQAEMARWRDLSYPDLAIAVIVKFVDDIPAADLERLIRAAYTPEIFCNSASGRVQEITPLKTLEPGLSILELSNGPTLAFKDIAMQLLGNLFEYALARSGNELNVLGATSGDTGSAAEYAMRGKRGISVFMLSPLDKMSPFQTAQMFSLQDANIFNVAVRGVFDQCQDMVKAVSNDLAFKERYRIGTVNSINWARLVAQVVYYFKGYFAATQSNAESVSFAVPSGNFGNVCAGHVARMMGLPIRQLILATNENDVLDEFFRTGSYRPRGSNETYMTSSPSMDISKASNFERFIFDLVGRDAGVVRSLWKDVETGGGFSLAGTPYFADIGRFGFVSGSSTHADRIATIRAVHARYGVLVDTHTADGIKVGLALREPGVPLICLETALPAKFGEAIEEAVGSLPPRPSGFERLEALPLRFEVMDVDAELIKRHIAAHAAPRDGRSTAART